MSAEATVAHELRQIRRLLERIADSMERQEPEPEEPVDNRVWCLQ